MRPQPSRSQWGNRKEYTETSAASRRRQTRSWLILGAGAIGVASALTKWAMRARQASAATTNSTLRSPVPGVSEAQIEGTGTPKPIQMSDAQEIPSAEPISATSASPRTSAGRNTKTTPSGTRKRSKMSQEYDMALQANAMPTDGREGERLNRALENNTMTERTSGPAPSQFAHMGNAANATTANSAQEQALSTQAEGKLAIGEELRDREFPVPPQETGTPPQKLAIDQETMTDNGPRDGGAIGTMPGDVQNVGTVGDIEDQVAKTPDFAQQR